METTKIEWCKVYINYDCNGIKTTHFFDRISNLIDSYFAIGILFFTQFNIIT
jgi:hypothetical protein